MQTCSGFIYQCLTLSNAPLLLHWISHVNLGKSSVSSCSRLSHLTARVENSCFQTKNFTGCREGLTSTDRILPCHHLKVSRTQFVYFTQLWNSPWWHLFWLYQGPQCPLMYCRQNRMHCLIKTISVGLI